MLRSSVAVVVPTYNERENLPDLIWELLALPLDIQIIVVDDHSPDGTGEVADRMAAETGRVVVIHRPRKLGLGTAYTVGFRRALDMGVDRVVTMDADFSHSPRYVPDLVAHSDTFD
ncbi:MAG: glycosyltransferase, partial [Anaerolineae bacterium]|nr:glycosyltransferase [Anaerolineae bacterium]